jgi:hypothetical protein
LNLEKDLNTPTGVRRKGRERLNSSDIRNGLDKEELEDWIKNNQEDCNEFEKKMIENICKARKHHLENTNPHENMITKKMTKLERIKKEAEKKNYKSIREIT